MCARRCLLFRGSRDAAVVAVAGLGDGGQGLGLPEMSRRREGWILGSSEESGKSASCPTTPVAQSVRSMTVGPLDQWGVREVGQGEVPSRTPGGLWPVCVSSVERGLDSGGSCSRRSCRSFPLAARKSLLRVTHHRFLLLLLFRIFNGNKPVQQGAFPRLKRRPGTEAPILCTLPWEQAPR